MGTFVDLTTNLNKNISEEEMFSHTNFETEIIRLQSYDNFYSLMDRLHQKDASGQGSHRLLLVWPVRGQILETPLEFGRLHNWAERNQYEIGLVIPGDRVYREIAMEQGIPAFANITEAGASDWKLQNKMPSVDEPEDRIRRLAAYKKDIEQAQRPQTPIGLRLLFFLLTLAVLGGVFYAIIPQAKVEITPYLTQKSINMTIWTDDRLDAPTLAGGVPTVEKKLELTLTAEVPASGQVQIEPVLSTGVITVRNTCDRVYASSAGVRISTSEDFDSGISFITLDAVTLEPGEEWNIRIEAETGGESGNLPAGSLKYAEYPKSLCWEIRQEKPTSGGSEGIYAAPNDADRQTAKQMIRDQLQEAARAALSNDPEGQDLIPLGDATVTVIKQEQMLPEAGFASETLSLRETLEVAFKAVRKSDMDAIIRGQSARMNLHTADFLGYEILAGPKEENGLSTWSVRADYLVYEPETNEEALQIMLRGKTIDQAYSILGTLNHVKSSSITLLPSGIKHLPLAAQNIRVTIYPAVEIEKP